MFQVHNLANRLHSTFRKVPKLTSFWTVYSSSKHRYWYLVLNFKRCWLIGHWTMIKKTKYFWKPVIMLMSYTNVFIVYKRQWWQYWISKWLLTKCLMKSYIPNNVFTYKVREPKYNAFTICIRQNFEFCKIMIINTFAYSWISQFFVFLTEYAVDLISVMRIFIYQNTPNKIDI